MRKEVNENMRKYVKKYNLLNDGLTLIELLAVIVIIAIISIITVPLAMNIIDEVKKRAFKNSAYGIVKAAELTFSENVLNDNIEEIIFIYRDGEEFSSADGKKLNYKGTKPKNGTVIINKTGQVGLALHNGKYCIEKGYNEDNVTLSEKSTYECIFREDTISPIITFEPNGTNNYIKSSNIKVSVIDQYLDENSLKYVWTTTEEIPNDEEYVNSFENNGYIAMPLDNGSFHLHVIAKDTLNNVTKEYRQFLLDNEAPVITLNGESTITINKGSTYVDAGATATDEHSGISGNVIGTGIVNTSIPGVYTITYTVSDNAGNEATPVIRTVTVVDAQAPVITILGNNPVNITVGSTYIDAGAIAIDDVDGDVTSKIVATGTVNINIPGTYYITYTVKDSANNEGIAVRIVNVIDNVPPTITFGTNGNSTYAKSRSTTVTVNDNVAINPNSLKYQWTTSTTTPNETTFTTPFTNGVTINTPSGVTGSYYLWILAKDTSENTTITRSNVFNLDNTKPVITLNGDSVVTVNKGSTYTELGATASDEHSGISGSVSISGTVNTNVIGTYTITYTISDKAGNTSTKTRTIEVIIPVFETCGDSLYDTRDGNIYKTVKIGNQCWMAENLRYTGNGCLTNPWNRTGCRKYTHQIYGEDVFYQWDAAMNGSLAQNSQGLCPDGWHIPSSYEWEVLENYVGGSDIAGTRLKSSIHWNGTNNYGFNALPSGFLSDIGELRGVGEYGIWWTSSLNTSSSSYRRTLSENAHVSFSAAAREFGNLVRCVKN